MKIMHTGSERSFAHAAAKLLARNLGQGEVSPGGSCAGLLGKMAKNGDVVGVFPYRGSKSGLFESSTHSLMELFDFDVLDVVDAVHKVYLYARPGDDGVLTKIYCKSEHVAALARAMRKKDPLSPARIEPVDDEADAAKMLSFSNEKGVAVACHLYAGLSCGLDPLFGGRPVFAEKVRYLAIKNVKTRKKPEKRPLPAAIQAPSSGNYFEREAPVSWDEYFMLQAMLAAFRSKDPSTQVGCVLVDGKRRQISFGYNGFPRGVDESKLPWGKEGDLFEHTKHAYVVHAEENAVYNANRDVDGAVCYVTLYPCGKCAKALVSEGIKEVVYLKRKGFDCESERVAARLFELAGVKVRKISIGPGTLKKLARHLAGFAGSRENGVYSKNGERT